jgi:hypothetical protein
VFSGCGLLPAALGAPSFQAASLVSPDAWAFTDLTLRPSVQQALYVKDVFDLYSNLKGPGGIGLSDLPTPSGRPVDFEKDVLPRLDGDVAFAASGTLDQPHGVGLVHTNDVNSILTLFAEERSPVFTKDARGAIRYDNGVVLAAGFKNWVVFSDDAFLLEQTLDRIDGKGGPSLATQSRYQSVIERLNGDRLGFGYVDLAPLVDSAAFQAAKVKDTASARGRLAYSLAFAPGPDAGTRALDVRFEFMPDAPIAQKAVPKGDALAAMDRLPKGSAFAFSGSSIGQVSDALSAYGADQVPDEVETFLHSFSGPFALGGSLTSGGSLANPGDFLGLVAFLGQLTPDADVETVRDATTAGLDLLVSDIDTWQYQVVTDANWLAINVAPATVQLDALPQDELASDQGYQSIRAGLTQDGTNSYINVRAFLAWGQNQGAPSEDLAAVRPIRAIGSSSHQDNDGASRGRMTVIIALDS